jgi:hypothetical protein
MAERDAASSQPALATTELANQRTDGLSLIALGTGGLILASIEHWRVLKELNAGRPGTRTWSLPLSIASLISLIGLTAFLSVLSKMGPF